MLAFVQNQDVHLWLVSLPLCELRCGQEKRQPVFLNVTPDDVLDLHDDRVRETIQLKTLQPTCQTQYLHACTHTHTHKETSQIQSNHSRGRWLHVFDLNVKDDWVYISIDLYKSTWRPDEEVDELRRKLPTVGNPTEDSWLLLCPSSFPQSLCSLHLPSAFCLNTSIWPCLPIYISFIFSLISFCTHTSVHAHTLAHTLQKWEPVVALEWESVDERRPICDWMTEWLKEWRAKAVKLSVSLHRSRRQEPTLGCKSCSQTQSYRVRSTRIGVFIKIHIIIILMVFMRWGWQMRKLVHQSYVSK